MYTGKNHTPITKRDTAKYSLELLRLHHNWRAFAVSVSAVDTQQCHQWTEEHVISTNLALSSHTLEFHLPAHESYGVCSRLGLSRWHSARWGAGVWMKSKTDVDVCCLFKALASGPTRNNRKSRRKNSRRQRQKRDTSADKVHQPRRSRGAQVKQK